ncbi:MAG: hypothetical protein N2111_14175 [Candidatus Sumerlaeaceae bacterium]|nr:hypothetical protein [Candidatus Sumerlaeaceae bacterium]
MATSKSAQAQPGLAGIATSIAANGVLAGLFMACVFVALSISSTVQSALQDRAFDAPATIVLRESVTESDAQALANRLRTQTPGLRADVIGQVAARALLGLQEPWMQRLPDLELAPLPILIEVRHPRLLEKGFDVPAFLRELESLPETDFVAFNTTGLDRFVEFADAARAYGRGLARGLAALGTLGALLLTLFLCRRRRYPSIPAAIVSAGILSAITVATGCIATSVILRQVSTSPPDLHSGDLLTAVAALTLSMSVFVLTELLRVRRKRRVPRRVAA